MSPKPVVPRTAADRDIEDALDHYLTEANEKTALGFVDAVERAFRHIAQPALRDGRRHWTYRISEPGR